MFDRDNIVGVLLLGLCAFLAGILLYAIGSGEQLTFDGPAWMGPVLMVVFIGLLIFGFVSSGGFGRFRRGGGGRAWPDPATGQRRRWRWPWQRDRE